MSIASTVKWTIITGMEDKSTTREKKIAVGCWISLSTYAIFMRFLFIALVSNMCVRNNRLNEGFQCFQSWWFFCLCFTSALMAAKKYRNKCWVRATCVCVTAGSKYRWPPPSNDDRSRHKMLMLRSAGSYQPVASNLLLKYIRRERHIFFPSLTQKPINNITKIPTQYAQHYLLISKARAVNTQIRRRRFFFCMPALTNNRGFNAGRTRWQHWWWQKQLDI